MTRLTSLAVCLFLTLTIAPGCKKVGRAVDGAAAAVKEVSPREAILGEWMAEDGELSYYFQAEGKLTADAKNGKDTVRVHGKYRFLADDRIELELSMTPGGAGLVGKSTVRFASNDQMLMTGDQSGKTTTYNRIR